MLRKCSFTFLFITYATSSFAWGELGHKAVALIAEDHLNPKAQKRLKTILDGQSIAEASNWPDEVRSDERYDFAKPWHFMDQNAEKKDSPRSSKENLLTAIPKMERILRGQDSPIRKNGVTIGKKEALKYLIHLLGDLHQPLHIGNGRDLGGNTCTVKWLGEVQHRTQVWNLHAVWDEGIIEASQLSLDELVRNSAQILNSSDIKKIQSGSYSDWAMESAQLRPSLYPGVGSELNHSYCGKYILPKNRDSQKIRKIIHTIEKDSEIPSLGKQYQQKFFPLVKDRIFKAGLRLAGTLNRLFD